MTSSTPTQELLTISADAASKIAALIAEEDSSTLKLRIYVTGGGCSGLQYGLTLTEEQATDDTLIIHSMPEQNICVQVLIDAISMQYLQGASVDYQQDINGEQFIIRNPNATTTCSCGSSFAVEN